MLTREYVAGKYALVPNRETVTVTLKRESGPVNVTVNDGAWRKDPRRILRDYSGVQLQGTEIGIVIADAALNSSAQGHEIRAQDEVKTSDGARYRIQSAAGRLMGTRWECVCQKIG